MVDLISFLILIAALIVGFVTDNWQPKGKVPLKVRTVAKMRKLRAERDQAIRDAVFWENMYDLDCPGRKPKGLCASRNGK